MRRNYIVSFTLLAGAILAPAFGGSAVHAHAPLQGQTPAANSNLKTAPSVVSLLAGEQGIGTASTDYVSVLDSNGMNHASDLHATPRDNATLITAPVSELKKGWYGVHWNITSEDGHPMGGESGAWWAFGVNGVTAKSSTSSFTARNVLPPAGATVTLAAKINGARVGTRTVTVVNKWGSVYSVKWVLDDPGHDTLNGATFTWFASCKKKTSTCTSTGVLPFPGTYAVTLQVISTAKTGSSTALWTSSLPIRA